MALCDASPEVVVAQAREVARHIPALYVVIVATVMMLVLIAKDVAPWWLVLGVPMIVWTLVLARILLWKRMRFSVDLTPLAALALLRGTVVLTLAFAIADVAWALAVLHYVGPGQTAMVMVIVVFTGIGSIFCLMHLPQAAIVIVPIALLPWIVIYARAGNIELAVLMAQVAMIGALMIRVLNRSFHSFTDLVRSRSALAEGQLRAQQLGEQNERFANMDSLTGLPNRRNFFARLDSLVGEREDGEAPFAVGLFDLDRFKPVNDTYGHVTGDRLLRELGTRLLAESGPDILIARLGGDEFGLLVLRHDGDAVAIGQRICDLVARPFRLDDLVVSIGCSFGLALYPEAGRSGRELLDRADYALYHRKTTVRGGLTLFTADHERSIRSTQILEAALQTADLDREMGLMYQPIVDTHRMTVVGVEALARWDSPVLGRVSPDQFIPVAESLGTIGTLTLTLLRKALDDARHLPVDIRLSFNLSANDIGAPETVGALIGAIEQSGFDPARITIEITETAVMRDFDVAVAAIQRLRTLGISMALDDFGTGFSSLTHLRRLPIDIVKIDRSFTADLHEESGKKIVSAVGSLCRNLGFDCVVEGVEEEHQLVRIRQFGYRLAQGYLFARPMTMPDLLDWLASDETFGSARMDDKVLPGR